MDKVIAIVGPTAVGKTALSFTLARHYETSLISGDAYQIYRHMDIGTAKPSHTELQQYTHYLIDIADPDEAYSAAIFCDMAGRAIHHLNEEGKLPIVVGGTGLYVQSLLEGYEFGAAKMDETVKAQAIARIAAMQREELQRYIQEETKWEPADWHELLANKHRLIRLVAAILNGEGKSFVRMGKADSLVYDAYVIGLRLPREVLYNRIEKRIDMMLDAGWVDEVRHLLDLGISPDAQSMKAIGYGEIVRYLQGEWSLTEAAEEIKKRTRHFAKRQLTWYKRMPYIHWFDKEQYSSEAALAADVLHRITF